MICDNDKVGEAGVNVTSSVVLDDCDGVMDLVKDASALSDTLDVKDIEVDNVCRRVGVSTELGDGVDVHDASFVKVMLRVCVQDGEKLEENEVVRTLLAPDFVTLTEFVSVALFLVSPVNDVVTRDTMRVILNPLLPAV